LPHKQILNFNEIRSEVFRELANPDQVAGRQMRSFPTLNKLLKGHRKGELSILTGPTGIGKTTIISQISMDLCSQGVNTLWGSFELNNVRLAKKMLNQFAQKNLEKHLAEFDLWADKFSQVPLYFMRFHGGTEVEAVLDAMDYAVYVYDVEHIVLDNLQFMMQVGHFKGYERFDQLDSAISLFRKFATEKNVHITLIIHPRKEDDGQALSINSVFGTAKATQEADNVIIVQKGKYYRYLEVTKNRFSGDLGIVPYKYDKESHKYFELHGKDLQKVTANSTQNGPAAAARPPSAPPS
jgi:twinkle protein